MCTDDKSSGWREISGVTAGATEKTGSEVVERGTGRLYQQQKRGSRMHTRFDIAAHDDCATGDVRGPLFLFSYFFLIPSFFLSFFLSYLGIMHSIGKGE
jgi:hypothetical protein